MDDHRSTALIVGVDGLSRSAHELPPGAQQVQADLQDPDSLAQALADVRPTDVFFTAWSRRENEEENIRVNGAVVRNLFDALSPAGTVRHAALVTGLKHYMGRFEAFGAGEMRETPFREGSERLVTPNFYYAQEDELFAAAELSPEDLRGLLIESL